MKKGFGWTKFWRSDLYYLFHFLFIQHTEMVEGAHVTQSVGDVANDKGMLLSRGIFDV